MSIRAKFQLAAEASPSDTKTTVHQIKTIQLCDQQEVYLFPADARSLSCHAELMKNKIIQGGIKSIKKRGQVRNLVITLGDDLMKIYLDEEHNVCFDGIYLDESVASTIHSTAKEHVALVTKKSLSSLTKDMVVDKFTGRNQNAKSWLNTFVSECHRMEITDNQRPEALRLFLEGSPTDWYSATRKIFDGNDNTWADWSQSFLDTYGDKELSDGLKLIDVKIDKHVVRGRSTTLECLFDLQGETLYSVKWYKDGHEFYRYVPQEVPPAQHFVVPGVHVDLDNSTEVQVKLMALELVSSGKYRCEVSAEAPSFQTVSAHSDMQVVALPEQGPTITGGRPRYQVGELVNLNCTSGPSQPPTHLQWYINGSPANSSHLRGPHTKKDVAGLAVTTLGLEFRVERRHFRKGDLKLKCLASIATVYWNSNEESVEGDRPQRPPALEVKDNLPYPSRADRVLVSTVSSGVYSRCSLVHVISLFMFVLLRS